MTAEDRQEWLKSTTRATEDMRNLVEEMLDLASIDNTNKKKQKTAVTDKTINGDDDSSVDSAYSSEDANISSTENTTNLSRILEASILQFESIAFERGFSINTQIEPDININCSKNDTYRLVEILLDNACKYINDEGSVSVNATHDAKNAIVVIKNTGLVIPDDALPHIFDRFYRVDSARTRGSGHRFVSLKLGKSF